MDSTVTCPLCHGNRTIRVRNKEGALERLCFLCLGAGQIDRTMAHNFRKRLKKRASSKLRGS